MPSFDSSTGRILFLGGLGAMVALLALSAPAARALRGIVGIRPVAAILYGSAALPMAAGGFVIGGLLPQGMWVVWLMFAGVTVWGLSLAVFAIVGALRSAAPETPQAESQPVEPIASTPAAPQISPTVKPPRAVEITDNPALPESEVKIRCTNCGRKMRAAGPKFAKQRRCPNCKTSPFRYVMEEQEEAEPAHPAPESVP